MNITPSLNGLFLIDRANRIFGRDDLHSVALFDKSKNKCTFLDQRRRIGDILFEPSDDLFLLFFP